MCVKCLLYVVIFLPLVYGDCTPSYTFTASNVNPGNVMCSPGSFTCTADYTTVPAIFILPAASYSFTISNVPYNTIASVDFKTCPTADCTTPTLAYNLRSGGTNLQPALQWSGKNYSPMGDIPCVPPCSTYATTATLNSFPSISMPLLAADNYVLVKFNNFDIYLSACQTCALGSGAQGCWNLTWTQPCVSGSTWSSTGYAPCNQCSSCTAGSTYFSSSCTLTSDTRCNPCISCLANQYITTACVTSNPVCSTCSVCGSGKYASTVCSNTTNTPTVCTTCMTCGTGFYASPVCTATTNAVCLNCIVCPAVGYYQATPCNATSNTVCNRCSTCTTGKYQSVACSATSDTVCSTCSTTCTVVATACTNTSNTVCVPPCVAGSTYSATGVTPCTPCNPCIPGYTQTAPCTATTDTSCMCVGCASSRTVLIGLSNTDYHVYKTTDLGTGASVVVPQSKDFTYSTWISASPFGKSLLLNDVWGQYLLDLNTGLFTTVSNSGTVRGSCMSLDGTFALVLESTILYQVDMISFQRTLLAGGYTGDGIGTDAGITTLGDIRIANSQTFAVFTDSNCIRTYTFATRAVLTIAGKIDLAGYVNGAGVATRFSQPRGLDVSQDGSYALVSDYSNNKIRKVMILTGITTTVASLTAHPMSIRFSYDYTVAYVSSTQGLHVITVSTSVLTTIGWAGANPQYWQMTFFTPPVQCVAGVTYSFNGNTPCSQCSSCAAGSILTSNCILTQDTTCMCIAGSTYSPTGMSPCTACDVCSSNYVGTTMCNTTSNTICTQTCTATQTYSSTGLVPCTGCPSCAPGLTYPSSGCNLTRATVCTPIRLNCQLVLMGQGSKLSQVFPAGVATLFANVSQAWSVTIVPNGTLAVVATNNGGYDSLYAVNLLTAQVAKLPTYGYDHVAALNNTFVIAHMQQATIDAISLSTFVRTTLVGNTVWPPVNQDGTGSGASVPYISDLVVAPNGSFVLLVDDTSSTVRLLDMATLSVSTLVGQLGIIGKTDGVGTAATFAYPKGVAISQDSSYALVADTSNSLIRRLDLSSRVVTTIVCTYTVLNEYIPGYGNTNPPLQYPDKIRFSADFSYALVSDWYGLRVLDIQTMTLTFLVKTSSITSIAVAPTPLCFTPCVAGSNFSATGVAPCTPCVTCGAGSYVSAACRVISNTVCSPCTNCTLGSTYEITSCGVSNDRVCTPCSGCVAGVNYQSTSCNLTSDSKCTQCTNCVAGSTYLSQTCTPGNDAVCSRCDSCPTGTFLGSPCTVLSNTYCPLCSTCPAGGSYQTAPCTLQSDTGCTGCSGCQSGVTYRSSPCNPTHDTACSACSVCTAGVNYSIPLGVCTPTTNTFCIPCTACTLGSTYQETPCTLNADSVCRACAVCPAGAIMTACTLMNNTVCSLPNTTSLLVTNSGNCLYQLTTFSGMSLVHCSDHDLISLSASSLNGDMFGKTLLSGSWTRGMESQSIQTRGGLSVCPNVTGMVAIMPDASFALAVISAPLTVQGKTEIAQMLWQVNLTTCLCTILSGGDSTAFFSDGVMTSLGFLGGVTDIQIAPNGLFALLVQSNQNKIQMYTFATKELTLLAGQPSSADRQVAHSGYVFHSGLYVDDVGILARFHYPWGVTISRDSTYALVADEANNVIRKVVIATGTVTTLVGTGVAVAVDGVVGVAAFDNPMFIQLSPDNSYAVVSGNDASGQLRSVNLTTLSVSTLTTGAYVSHLAFVQFAPGTHCFPRRYSPSGTEPCEYCSNCIQGLTFEPTDQSLACCLPCDVCKAGNYSSVVCTTTGNTVCSACITCNPGVTYTSSVCIPTANTVCTVCSVCVSGVTYTTSRCNISSNTVCSPCTVCGTGNYKTGNCSIFNNTLCTQCKSGMCLPMCI